MKKLNRKIRQKMRRWRAEVRKKQRKFTKRDNEAKDRFAKGENKVETAIERSMQVSQAAASLSALNAGSPRRQWKLRRFETIKGGRRQQLVTSPPQFITLWCVWSLETLFHHLHLPQPNTTTRTKYLIHPFSLCDWSPCKRMTNLMSWGGINWS